MIGRNPFNRAGLVKNASIPDPMASRSVSACATPVNARIMVRLLFSSVFSNSRMRRVDSIPSMMGIEMSASKLEHRQEKKPNSLKLTHKNDFDVVCILLEDVEGLLSVVCNGITVA